MTHDQYVKQYAYNIRHMYGKEGVCMCMCVCVCVCVFMYVFVFVFVFVFMYVYMYVYMYVWVRGVLLQSFCIMLCILNFGHRRCKNGRDMCIPSFDVFNSVTCVIRCAKELHS